MGHSKPHLLVNNKRLIDLVSFQISDLFDELLVVLKGGMREISPYRCVYDNYQDYSPLFGIYTGILYSSSYYNFIIGCDMPFASRELVSFILREAEKSAADVVVPVVRGFYEPLFAVYSKNCIPTIERNIKNGVFKVTSFYDDVRLHVLSEETIMKYDSGLQSFVNINTREDLRKAFALDDREKEDY